MPGDLIDRPHYLVAGAGIEPASGGYAYHYNFHCPIVCGLDYAFTREGCLPSSLYTFPVR